MVHRVDSSQLEAYTLKNSHGIQVTITNFGGKIMSIQVPDRNSTWADVTLGYDQTDQYLNGNPYFGAIIGRYGNRIAKGKFAINGNMYELPINSRQDSLHGGPTGFHNQIWQAKVDHRNEAAVLHLTYVSSDGEAGYPGTLKVEVIYALTDKNELVIDYLAETDRSTIINLTNHAFFNLRGEGSNDVLNHLIKINAKSFTPVREGLIPTGEIKSVKGTPFDFTEFHAISERIDLDEEQLRLGRGYDHNWVLDKKENEFSLAAVVREPQSGRELEVWTTEPGLQFYSGNFLDGSDIGKGGKSYKFRSAFCLEAQHFPDSPNQPNFPSTLLKPGETYRQKTMYKFGVYTE